MSDESEVGPRHVFHLVISERNTGKVYKADLGLDDILTIKLEDHAAPGPMRRKHSYQRAEGPILRALMHAVHNVLIMLWTDIDIEEQEKRNGQG